MQTYSETAWNIASRYSHVLASETRDLAAWIDAALKAERERCASIAENRNYGGNTEYDAGRRLACLDIASAIRGEGGFAVEDGGGGYDADGQSEPA